MAGRRNPPSDRKAQETLSFHVRIPLPRLFPGAAKTAATALRLRCRNMDLSINRNGEKKPAASGGIGFGRILAHKKLITKAQGSPKPSSDPLLITGKTWITCFFYNY